MAIRDRFFSRYENGPHYCRKDPGAMLKANGDALRLQDEGDS